jgi:hypothetical protein
MWKERPPLPLAFFIGPVLEYFCLLVGLEFYCVLIGYLTGASDGVRVRCI